jgi:D-alanyl-D-alanine endopeptidase (penicillin-binding protein 7)
MRGIILTILTLLSTSVLALEPPSVVVYNISLDQTVISDNADTVRPMASITKLMTAMVALDHYPLDQKIRTGKKSTATVEQLLTNVLVRSDNAASELLARNHPHGRGAFLDAMNSKAQFLGLKKTEFRDASGLDAGNITTANELTRMVAHAGTYPFIGQTSTQVEITRIRKIKNRTRTVSLPNTNKNILFEYDNILVSKTGTTSKAGKCLAMLVDNRGEQYAIIILGEPSKQARDRVARNLIQASKLTK